MPKKKRKKSEEGSETLEMLLILAVATAMVAVIVLSAKGVKDTAPRANMSVTQSQDSYLKNWKGDD